MLIITGLVYDLIKKIFDSIRLMELNQGSFKFSLYFELQLFSMVQGNC